MVFICTIKQDISGSDSLPRNDYALWGGQLGNLLKPQPIGSDAGREGTKIGKAVFEVIF